MGYPELERRDVRDRILDWLKQDGSKTIAFLCADGAGRQVRFDARTGESKDLPGYHVVGIPCAAWLHSSFVELIARRGGRALLAACEGSEPRCRLGTEITAARVAEEREPVFDSKRIPASAFRFLQLESGDLETLTREAADFLDGTTPTEVHSEVPLRRRLAVAALLVVVLGGATVLFSRFVYVAPERAPSTLIVSFKHAGQEKTDGGEVDSQLGHLKGMKERAELVPVRLKVAVDGEVVFEENFEPRGIRNNSASVGAVELPMQPGTYRVQVWLGESADNDEWTYVLDERVEFDQSKRRVLQFDKSHGFRWD
jgi:hypothetical protein